MHKNFIIIVGISCDLSCNYWNMPRPLGEDLRWRIVWLRVFLGHRFRFQMPTFFETGVYRHMKMALYSIVAQTHLKS